MLCFSSAVEALRIANRMSGRNAVFEWTLLGEGGEIAWCSAGIGFKLDSDLRR
jgi:transcriptional regulator GlxA family with amidase domain